MFNVQSGISRIVCLAYVGPRSSGILEARPNGLRQCRQVRPGGHDALGTERSYTQPLDCWHRRNHHEEERDEQAGGARRHIGVADLAMGHFLPAQTGGRQRFRSGHARICSHQKMK